MAEIRGVILDVDGTLVDSNNAHANAWTEAMMEDGHRVTYEKIRRLIGMGSDKLLPRTVGVSKTSPEGKKLSDSWKKIFEERYLSELEAFPQARDLVQKMHDAGLQLVVASSAEPDELEKLLKITGVEGLIKYKTSSKEAKNSKPSPDIITVALEKLGLPQEEVIMVGDTPYDIEAAGKAGIGTVAFRCGGWNDEDLKGAVAIYDGPADLLANYDTSPFGKAEKLETNLPL